MQLVPPLNAKIISEIGSVPQFWRFFILNKYICIGFCSTTKNSASGYGVKVVGKNPHQNQVRLVGRAKLNKQRDTRFIVR